MAMRVKQLLQGGSRVQEDNDARRTSGHAAAIVSDLETP
jgi:hypothetical protein